MRKLIWNICKLTVVFMAFSFLFYTGITYFHSEYQYQKMFDEPGGRAVKVLNELDQVVDRMHVFLRLGE